MVRNVYDEPTTLTSVPTLGFHRTVYQSASTLSRRILQGNASVTKLWKYKEDMTSAFTLDWYLTQSFGLYCGYTREISFLVNSDYKKKDCLLPIQLTTCSTSDPGYQQFSVAMMMSKVQTAFNITDSTKVIPLFVYTLPSGQKAVQTDISSLSFTATPNLPVNPTTCTLENYPSSIRVVLSVNNQVVEAARLMIYIRQYV